MNTLRRAIRDLNLGAAKLRLFGVNMFHAARIFGLGTQAQNTCGAKHIYIPVKCLSIRILFNSHFLSPFKSEKAFCLTHPFLGCIIPLLF